MKYSIDRILLGVTLCLILGISSSAQETFRLLAVMLSFGGIVLWCVYHQESWKRCCVYMISMVIGIMLMGQAMTPMEALRGYLNHDIVVEGLVTDAAIGKHYFMMSAENVNGEPIKNGGKLLIMEPYGQDILVERGSRITVNGSLGALDVATNPGEFSAKNHWNSREVYYQVKIKTPPTLIHHGEGIWALSNTLSERLKNCLHNALSESQYQVVLALLLGDKSELDQSFYSLSQKFGIAHVFAVSGLHVGFLVAGLMGFLKLFKLERSWGAVIIVSAILMLYCFMVGLTPSAMRAAIMAILGFLAMKWLRFKDMYTIIALAALVILLATPQVLWSVGFQLSFMAVLGIVFLYPPIVKRLNMIPIVPLRSALAVALAAQLATAPIVAWHFYMFSMYSPLLNVIIVPLIGILVPALLVAVVGSLCLPFLQTLFFLPCQLLLLVIDKILYAIAGLIGTGHTYIGQPKFMSLVIFYGVLMIWQVSWSKVVHKKMVATFYTGIICLSWVWGLPNTPQYDQITFLDVGQGSCAVFESADDHVVVFDGGVSQNILVSYLRYCGINKVDVVVLSHGDIDHTAGLHKVFEDVKVGYFVLPYGSLQTDDVKILLETLAETNTTIMPVKTHVNIRLDRQRTLMAEVYGVATGASNDMGVVAKLNTQGTVCAFPGDLGKAELAQWLLREQETIDVFAVPHHGSKNSLYPGFYDRLMPKVTIISSGRDNRYGHPHQDVLDQLVALQLRYYRTDTSGAVTIKMKPEKLVVKQYIDL